MINEYDIYQQSQPCDLCEECDHELANNTPSTHCSLSPFQYFLFDLENDPSESTNLYFSDDAEHLEAKVGTDKNTYRICSISFHGSFTSNGVFFAHPVPPRTSSLI